MNRQRLHGVLRDQSTLVAGRDWRGRWGIGDVLREDLIGDLRGLVGARAISFARLADVARFTACVSRSIHARMMCRPHWSREHLRRP